MLLLSKGEHERTKEGEEGQLIIHNIFYFVDYTKLGLSSTRF